MEGTGKQAELLLNIDVYLLLGRILFHNGATVTNIVDSIEYLHRYFNKDDELHILVEYDAIIITDTNKKRFETKIDKARGFSTVNIQILQEISNFLKNLPEQILSPAAIWEKLLIIEKMTGSIRGCKAHLLLGFTAVTFGFLNNTDLWGALCIFPAAIVVSFCRTILLARNYNIFLVFLLALFAGEVVVCLLMSFVPTQTPLIAVVSLALPLVPGFPLINGGLDILRNRNTVGVDRIAYCVMMIVTLTIAVFIPVKLFSNAMHARFVWQLSDAWLLTTNCLAGGVGALALAITFNSPRQLLLLFFLGGLTARGLRTVGIVFFGVDMATAALCGTMAVTISSHFFLKRYNVRMATYSLVCILPMIPGYFFIHGISGLYVLSKLQAAEITFPFYASVTQDILHAVFIVLALLVGIIFPVLVMDGRNPKI
ncbi:MAG: threonine/serine exporter family protein [Syntrophus sp. (in: bacteria)]